MRLNIEKLDSILAEEESKSQFRLGSFYFKAGDIPIKDSKLGYPIGSKISLEGLLPTYTNVLNPPVPEAQELEEAETEIFDWLVEYEVVRDRGRTVPKTKATIRGILHLVFIATNGKYKANDPRSVHMASKAVLQLIVDDMVEKLEIFETDGNMGKAIVQAIKKVIETKSLKEVDENNLASFPALEPPLRALRALDEKAERLIPNKSPQFIPETYSSFLNSTIFIQREKNQVYQVPEETFLFLRSKDVAATIVLEAFGTAMGFEVSEDVKNYVLCERIVQVGALIGSILNDLVGIRKDLLSPEKPGVGLVFYYVNNQKLTISEAWNRAIEKLYSYSNELMFLINKTLEAFPLEEKLEEYFETSLRLLDINGYYSVTYLSNRYLLETDQN